MQEKSAWGFREGDQIVPGRHATRLLGGGRRYEAYLAWDDALHALVVVKIVRPSLVESESVRRGLEGEARALVALNHPTIVRMFDAVLEGERPHVVLEYLDGPRLSTLIRRYRVIVEQLLPLGLELCSALHYMHGRGFLHLDVKPRNVVMSGRPRLIDLSVAIPADGIGAITRPIGTDAYMAPEQCRPTPAVPVGPPADIWGLGATLFEAVAGRRGWPDVDGFPQTVDGPGMLPPDTPMPLVEVIFACLDRDPSARPEPAELVEAVEPLLAAMPRRPVLSRLRPRLVGARR